MQRNPRTHFLKTSLTAIGALALVGATFAGTASATGSHEASGQAAPAHQRSTWTEDNDTNDGGTPNNVADAGDNRHPSGKDRSVEHGGSGTQGRSGSDPDGMTNGGADKPNGPGGIDKADQDGNNGCGNDDDFEDDNNGNCGGKAHAKAAAESSKPAKPATTCTCSHAPATPAPPAAKPATAEHTKAEHGKAEHAKAEHAKAEHGTTSCDRRNDERDQHAARAEHQATSDTATSERTKAGDTATFVAAAPATTVPAPTPPTTAPAPTTPPTTAVPGEVLGASAVAAPASAESPAIPGDVLAAEATAPAAPASVAPASSHHGNVVAAAASGALAFTGSNLLSLLVAGLLAIAIGWFVLRADRKRNA